MYPEILPAHGTSIGALRTEIPTEKPRPVVPVFQSAQHGNIDGLAQRRSGREGKAIELWIKRYGQHPYLTGEVMVLQIAQVRLVMKAGYVTYNISDSEKLYISKYRVYDKRNNHSWNKIECMVCTAVAVVKQKRF